MQPIGMAAMALIDIRGYSDHWRKSRRLWISPCNPRMRYVSITSSKVTCCRTARIAWCIRAGSEPRDVSAIEAAAELNWEKR
jgi:hypothetical protein